MNVFEDEDRKPPWKTMFFPEVYSCPEMGGVWDVVSDREDGGDSFSITDHSIEDEKLCKLWAKAPEILQLLKSLTEQMQIILCDIPWGKPQENVDKANKLIKEIEL